MNSALMKGAKRLNVDARFEPLTLPKPLTGKTAMTAPLRGTVTYQPPVKAGSAARAAQSEDGAPFVALDERQILPVGAIVDATKGALRLTVSGARGRSESIDLSGGMFVFRQTAKGRTTFQLTTVEANPCATGDRKRVLQRLTASGAGTFSIRTRFAESSAGRARWTVEDRCDGTRTKVTRGVVTVRDLAAKRTRRVRPGHTHIARG
jgi:hypothetical protein